MRSHKWSNEILVLLHNLNGRVNEPRAGKCIGRDKVPRSFFGVLVGCGKWLITSWWAYLCSDDKKGEKMNENKRSLSLAGVESVLFYTSVAAMRVKFKHIMQHRVISLSNLRGRGKSERWYLYDKRVTALTPLD
ncbi:hypothetical protein BJ165DRAFT_1406874 [Panaeolus papilionaceus]|nr:hypothetical protein BJ165DRAFT_1406874 [Panaeolus papilionaceus]